MSKHQNNSTKQTSKKVDNQINNEMFVAIMRQYKNKIYDRGQYEILMF